MYCTVICLSVALPDLLEPPIHDPAWSGEQDPNPVRETYLFNLIPVLLLGRPVLYELTEL